MVLLRAFLIALSFFALLWIAQGVGRGASGMVLLWAFFGNA